MFQLEAMLSLLIFAILGTPAFSETSKSSLESVTLPGGHPVDMGTLLSLPQEGHGDCPSWLQGWEARPSTWLKAFSPFWVFVHTEYHGTEVGKHFCTDIPKGKILTAVRAGIRGRAISR